MYNAEQIKNDCDLITIAELAGARFHRAGDEWRSSCPLHGGDNSSAFAVYNDGKTWTCFTHDCGTGDVISFVEKWKGYDFQQACEWLGGDNKTDTADIEKARIASIEKRLERIEQKQAEQEKIIEEIQKKQNWILYNETLEDNPNYQTIWEAQGIPQSWQSFWQLGYCERFTARSDNQVFSSPSLTIPIFVKDKVMNIRHRLLKPLNPKDKYRPERPGLSAFPFYANPSVMYEPEYILYVEGEKKAMVTFLTLDSDKWQVIGIPGKNQWKKEVDKLDGKRVITLLDPDALEHSIEFSKAVDGYYIDLPYKIDDLIIEMELGKMDLQKFLRTARAA